VVDVADLVSILNNKMKIYPVIHFLNRELALQQVALARECGATGVFLISHQGDDYLLVDVAREAKIANPTFQIGINLLSKRPLETAALAQLHGLDMVWADDMGVDSHGVTDDGKYLAHFAQTNPTIKLFASVAFKYRPNEPYPCIAATNAQTAGFIPTTSGSGTGSAPEVDKIRAMYAATKGELAVASGMTPENVGDYASYLSHILVATGVSLDEHRIDESKLKALISACNEPAKETDGANPT
jgi:predicted TIM-barrel enzyme